jgi:hypothetical protein
LLSALAACALAACASTVPEDDADESGATEDALITASERALVGSYRASDPSSPIVGFYTKDPTKNFAFEKKVVFTLDADPSKFPGVADRRISGVIVATKKTLDLRAARPAEVDPALAPLLGKYRYTLGPTSLVLTRGATTLTFDRASYCKETYDCNMQAPDDTCATERACSAQQACVVTQADPTCDPTWRSVASLGDIAGTWTSVDAPASAYAKLELTAPPPAAQATTSHGTFRGTTAAGATETGTFDATPENAAIGFAFLTLAHGAANDLVVVKGVRLSASGKIEAMRVHSLQAPAATWVYTRTP